MKQQSPRGGFTLVELMVAAVIGMISILVAGRVMTDQMEASQKIGARERLRSHWLRADRFITNEVNLANRVTTQLTAAEAAGDAKDCADLINNENGTIDMVVHFPRHYRINPAVYYRVPSQQGWNDNVLKRCGPTLTAQGTYGTTISNDIIIDGLYKDDSVNGFDVEIPTNQQKLVKFSISLKGLRNQAYTQQEGARARVDEIFLRPNETRICRRDQRQDQNGVKVSLSKNRDPRFDETLSGWSTKTNGDVLICGNGGGDTIHGNAGNDLIESGDSIRPGNSSLNGGDGNDRLVGGSDNDTIEGGTGNDTLIGLQGIDLLRGSSGTNHYVPGIDDTTATCDRDRVQGGKGDTMGYDIIYFKDKRSDYIESNNCNSTQCRVQRKDSGNRKTVDIEEGDLLVYQDQQVELAKGDTRQLPALPSNCDQNTGVGSSSGTTAGGTSGTNPSTSNSTNSTPGETNIPGNSTTTTTPGTTSGTSSTSGQDQGDDKDKEQEDDRRQDDDRGQGQSDDRDKDKDKDKKNR